MSVGHLDVECVRMIYSECQFCADEHPGECVWVEGYRVIGQFHRTRLRAHREEIIRLLAQLPETFMVNQPRGGGDSLARAHYTGDGCCWTDAYPSKASAEVAERCHPVEQLLLLGLATGRVVFSVPREYQDLLAGGVPYIVIRDDDTPEYL